MIHPEGAGSGAMITLSGGLGKRQQRRIRARHNTRHIGCTQQSDIILAIAETDHQRSGMIRKARTADDVVEGGFVMLPGQAADAPTTMNSKAGVLQL